MVEGKVSTHLSDGSGAPDGDHVALVDGRIDDAVPGRANHVREVETFLIRDIIWKREKIDVAVWYADVLCLATGETTCEVRVAEHT